MHALAFRTVIEQLKQRIILKDTQNGWGYTEGCEQIPAKLFVGKQHAAILQKSCETCENEAADAAEAQGFWNRIWGKIVTYNKDGLKLLRVSCWTSPSQILY